MIGLVIIALLISTGKVLCSLGNQNVVLSNLQWKYTRINENCTSATGRNPCKDIRVCDFARAAMIMGGRPAICKWVAADVPKVCCGLPLVLGEKLMRQVEAEKARTRECGRTIHASAVSETERTFFRIKDSLPPIDIRNPEKYDPPLDLTSLSMVSPVGGSTTIEGKYPWMVAIFRGPIFLCGGTLIDRIHILSAAHCFATSTGKLDPELYYVRIGSIQVNKGERFDVSNIIVHENYNPGSHYNDIAILTLEKEILTPSVAHICLPDIHTAARDLTGENATLLGWGDLEFGGRRTPVLHEVINLPIVSNVQCSNVYQQQFRQNSPQDLTDNFICAGLPEGGKDACQYDSGGPLMYLNRDANTTGWNIYPFVLVGIVSFGHDCGKAGYPGVYTRVSSFMDWIKQNTGKTP